MTTELLLEEDQDEVTLDEVKDYLQNTIIEEKDSLFANNLADTPDENRVQVEPNKLFNTDNNRNYYNNMFVVVRDDQHVITQEDKDKYLEAMLMDTQLELPIVMQNGITIVCRDLNMYERELTMEVMRDKIKETELPTHLLVHILKNLRLPMQIVSINNKKFDTIRFEYKKVDKHQFEKDKEELKTKYDEVVMPMTLITQSLCTKALNIFEHKLARLEEAAFNTDFWNPVGHA